MTFETEKNKLRTLWNEINDNTISLDNNATVITKNNSEVKKDNVKNFTLQSKQDLDSEWATLDEFLDSTTTILDVTYYNYIYYKRWQIVFEKIDPIISSYLNYKIVYKIGENISNEEPLTDFDSQLSKIRLSHCWEEIDIEGSTKKKMIFNVGIVVDDILASTLENTVSLIKFKLKAGLINPYAYNL